MKLAIAAVAAAFIPFWASSLDAQDDVWTACWQNLRVGDSVTLTSDQQTAIGNTPVVRHHEMTRTVDSITSDFVNVKVVFTGYLRVPSTGATRQDPPRSMNQPVPRPAVQGMTLLGTEAVDALGRTFQTQVYRMTAGGGKIYVSREVPFCTVKMELPSAGPAAAEVMVLSAYHRL